MALTFEEARLRLAVAEELAAGRDMRYAITETGTTDALTAVLTYVLNHGDIRARVEELDVEVELIRLAKDGDEDALLRLILAYAEAIRGLAAEYRRRVRNDELIEALGIALATCVAKYDPERGTPLTPMFRLHGKAAMKEMLNPATRLYGFTVEVRTLGRYWAILKEGARRFEAENGYEPLSYDDTYPYAVKVATERAQVDPKHALSVDTFCAIFAMHSTRVQLDAPVDERGSRPSSTYSGGNQECTLAETIAAPAQPGLGPDDAFNTALCARLMREELDADETEVIRYAYGFPPQSFRAMSDDDVAEELRPTRGYSRSTVNRMRRGSIRKMRAALAVEVED